MINGMMKMIFCSGIFLKYIDYKCAFTGTNISCWNFEHQKFIWEFAFSSQLWKKSPDSLFVIQSWSNPLCFPSLFMEFYCLVCWETWPSICYCLFCFEFLVFVKVLMLVNYRLDMILSLFWRTGRKGTLPRSCLLQPKCLLRAVGTLTQV